MSTVGAAGRMAGQSCASRRPAGHRRRRRAGRRPGDQPAQRALPDRLHRVERSTVAARRRARPVRHRRPLHHPGRGAGARHRGAGRSGDRRGPGHRRRPWRSGTDRLRVARRHSRRSGGAGEGAGRGGGRGRGPRAGVDPAGRRGPSGDQGRRRDRVAAPRLRRRRPGAGRVGGRGGAAAGAYRARGRPGTGCPHAAAGRGGAVVRDDRRRRCQLGDPAPPARRHRAARRGFPEAGLRRHRRRLPLRHDPHPGARARGRLAARDLRAGRGRRRRPAGRRWRWAPTSSPSTQRPAT